MDGTSRLPTFRRPFARISDTEMSTSSEGEMNSGTPMSNASSPIPALEGLRFGDEFSHGSWDLVEDQPEYTTQAHSEFRAIPVGVEQNTQFWMSENANNGPWVPVNRESIDAQTTNNTHRFCEDIDLEDSLPPAQFFTSTGFLQTQSMLVDSEYNETNAHDRWNSDFTYMITQPEESSRQLQLLQNQSDHPTVCPTMDTPTDEREFTPCSSTGEGNPSFDTSETRKSLDIPGKDWC